MHPTLSGCNYPLMLFSISLVCQTGGIDASLHRSRRQSRDAFELEGKERDIVIYLHNNFRRIGASNMNKVVNVLLRDKVVYNAIYNKFLISFSF